MTGSELRGIIEDFLFDLKKFQANNTSQEIEDLCDLIVSDLDSLDTMLSKGEDSDE